MKLPRLPYIKFTRVLGEYRYVVLYLPIKGFGWKLFWFKLWRWGW